jgi:hypothetical protein
VAGSSSAGSSHRLYCSGGKITGIRSCSVATFGLGAVVKMEQVSTGAPLGSRQVLQIPAMA